LTSRQQDLIGVIIDHDKGDFGMIGHDGLYFRSSSEAWCLCITSFI
jgi:hypothetical protein